MVVRKWCAAECDAFSPSPQTNKLKTTPTPNNNCSYGIIVGVCMHLQSEFVVYHFLCESPCASRDFLCHTTPHSIAYCGSIFFASMGGGGGQNCFHQKLTSAQVSPFSQGQMVLCRGRCLLGLKKFTSAQQVPPF